MIVKYLVKSTTKTQKPSAYINVEISQGSKDDTGN